MFCDICQSKIHGMPGRIGTSVYHHPAGALSSCYLRAVTLRFGVC